MTLGRTMQRHLLTICVEDYFHVAALRGAVRRKHWDRLDPRLERNLDSVLDLLDRHGAQATFFVFGCIAEQQPELVARIVRHGHEVASRGFWPRALAGLTPDELRADARRAKEALEAAGSNTIVGYRAPEWLHEDDLWVLDVLADEGYAYDSSINPVLRRFASDPRRFRIHDHTSPAGNTLRELPISTVGALGVRMTISGGNYVRQLPHTLLSRAVEWQSKRDDDPLVFYFMPWEMDKHQPHVQGISRLNRIRHYRNLAKTRWVLVDYFGKYEFVGVSDWLGLPHAAPEGAPARASVAPPGALAAPDPRAREVSLVVPMYDEEANIDYLRRTLLEFRKRLRDRYRIHLVLVDDASKDRTWELLQASFGELPDVQLVRHPRNRGVAAAIVTGIRAAPTEIVGSIDCDCSYDPADLGAMIPLIDDADLVTASPYHPAGAVVNVPTWRLFLSKTLSRMYSALLGDAIHTYTSCCRVYRKSQIEQFDLRHDHFLGVAELLIELKLRGARVIEYPATLESRLFGESKMKILRTIRGHLGLVGDLAFGPRTRPQLTRAAPGDAPAAAEHPVAEAAPPDPRAS